MPVETPATPSGKGCRWFDHETYICECPAGKRKAKCLHSFQTVANAGYGKPQPQWFFQPRVYRRPDSVYKSVFSPLNPCALYGKFATSEGTVPAHTVLKGPTHMHHAELMEQLQRLDQLIREDSSPTHNERNPTTHDDRLKRIAETKDYIAGGFNSLLDAYQGARADLARQEERLNRVRQERDRAQQTLDVVIDLAAKSGAA